MFLFGSNPGPKYRVMKQSANMIWVLPLTPEQERVFQIFSSKIRMAAMWEKSPMRRKMFMVVALN